jgi:isopropylmalate/homocitrate/citramalate synthase
MQLERDELNEAFKRFKQLADERKQVTLYDVFEREAAIP